MKTATSAANRFWTRRRATGGLLAAVLCLGLLSFLFPKLFRGRQARQRSECIRNLDLIDTAKALWSSDLARTNGTPAASELDKYIVGGFAGLHCPGGGTYQINPLGTFPVCSVARHNQ